MQANKPDYTTAIAQVKAGEVIPPTLLQKLVDENRSAVGFVVREPDRLVVEKFPRIDDAVKNFNFMTKVMEATKKYPAMFIFHNFPVEFDEDEVQPYNILKDSKGNILLSVAIEGDFVNRDSAEFSEGHMLVMDWLGPKIEDMYKLVGNSPTKLFDYLRSSQFQNDFQNTLGHRGVVAFMPSIGDPFVIEKNDLGIVSKTWGSCSNAYGYTESAIEAATPATVEKPATPAAKASRYADDAPTPAAPKPVVEPPKVIPEPAKDPVEKVATDLQPEEIEWTPPKGVHGKPLKTAYRAVLNGELPVVDAAGRQTTWRERPTVRIKVKKAAPAAAKAADTAVKDMKPAAPVPVAAKPLTMPIIGGAQQSKAVDMIKKHLGDGSLIIEDPAQAQADEKKLAKFSELVLKTGKIDEVNRWKTEFVFAFVKDNPETAALAFIELRSERNRLMALLTAKGEKLSDLTGTDMPVAPAATPPSIPSTPAVKVPAERKISKYA